MNIEQLREYCLSKKGTEESFPFDDKTLVFKVMNKIYALIPIEKGFINLKCDPCKAIDLREEYSVITPGYHMNKKHWNSIDYKLGSIPDNLLFELIDGSYNLIINSLSKKIKSEFMRNTSKK